MRSKYFYFFIMLMSIGISHLYASTFSFKQKIQADDNSTNYLFSAKQGVATYGNTIVIGSYGRDNSKGGVYVYELNATSKLFEQVATLTPSIAVVGAEFGASVAIYQDTIVVGSPYINSYAGQVYVYEKPASGWKDMNETALLTNSQVVGQSKFGSNVAIYQNTVAANSPDTPLESVSIFEKGGAHWSDMNESATLTSPSNLTSYSWFGSSLALDASTLVVGTYFDSNENGAVLVFEKPISGWKDMNHSTAKLTMKERSNKDRLGSSVAISGDIIMASAPFYANNKGAVFAFKKASLHWSDMNASAKIQTQAFSYQFGQSLCLVGNTLIATQSNGGFFYDINTTLTNDVNISNTLNPNPMVYSVGYGEAVGCSEKYIVMSAPYESNYEGRAYVFDANISQGVTFKSKLNPSLLMYLLN